MQLYGTQHAEELRKVLTSLGNHPIIRTVIQNGFVVRFCERCGFLGPVREQATGNTDEWQQVWAREMEKAGQVHRLTYFPTNEDEQLYERVKHGCRGERVLQPLDEVPLFVLKRLLYELDQRPDL